MLAVSRVLAASNAASGGGVEDFKGSGDADGHCGHGPRRGDGGRVPAWEGQREKGGS